MKKSPIATVNEKFGTKAKLVEAVEKFANDDLWVNRTNADKGLAHVSNAKLLKLLATFTTVKEKFGTRAKLIEAILEIEKRTKDAGYKTRLSAFPVPRLFDLYRSTAKRSEPKTAAKKSPAKLAGAAKSAPKKATVKSKASK